MKRTFWKILLLLALSGASPAADLTSLGDWVANVNVSNLAAGAGSDLPARLESLSGVTTLTITNAPGAWRLSARRNGSQGNSDVGVHVKRLSGGSGSGTIVGGTAYVELTSTNTELFTGSGIHRSIPLQFKLTGLSRKLPPATYLSSILFTVQ